MEKKHQYYGKSMIIDFSDFPHTMGFVAFSRTKANLWGTKLLIIAFYFSLFILSLHR